MSKIEITLLNRRFQCLRESINIRSKINAGKARVLGFTIKSGQDTRTSIETDIPFQVQSEKELVEFVRLMETKYDAEPGSVSLLAELNESGDECNIGKFIVSVSAEEKCESATYTVEGEISLSELVLQNGADRVAQLIEERLIYPCKITLNEDKPEADAKWFMPNYRIFVETSGNQEALKKEMSEQFEVLEIEQSEHGVYFYCYAGEGPVVHCVNDVLWVILELFGPKIMEKMEAIGVADYMIEFEIDELL